MHEGKKNLCAASPQPPNTHLSPILIHRCAWVSWLSGDSVSHWLRSQRDTLAPSAVNHIHWANQRGWSQATALCVNGHAPWKPPLQAVCSGGTQQEGGARSARKWPEKRSIGLLRAKLVSITCLCKRKSLSSLLQSFSVLCEDQKCYVAWRIVASPETK